MPRYVLEGVWTVFFDPGWRIQMLQWMEIALCLPWQAVFRFDGQVGHASLTFGVGVVRAEQHRASCCGRIDIHIILEVGHVAGGVALLLVYRLRVELKFWEDASSRKVALECPGPGLCPGHSELVPPCGLFPTSPPLFVHFHSTAHFATKMVKETVSRILYTYPRSYFGPDECALRSFK